MRGSCPPFRLILHDRSSGAWNMAVDHALLDGMEGPAARPVIRLYGFAPPTLSLGRFQKAREVLDVDAVRRGGLDLVRRPTGGQAVLHDGELTYSVVLGRAHLEPFSKREVYRFVARTLAQALEGLGLRVLLSGERRGDLHNPDCFRTTGEYEITDPEGRKLVGSAQLVTRSGALQHGAIPLDESNRAIARYLRGGERRVTHDSTSIRAMLGRDMSFRELRDSCAHALAHALEAEADELDAGERERATGRLRELYASDEWNLSP